MAVGLAGTVAQSMLNAFLNATAYTGPASLFIKLHIGDPGAAGTANPAANTTRQAASFGTATTGGVCSNDAAVTWTNVPNAEDYTHASVWDNVSAGTFQGSGTITANAVGVGDDFTLPIGDLDVTLNVAA